jgi:hypothetical protein
MALENGRSSNCICHTRAAAAMCIHADFTLESVLQIVYIFPAFAEQVVWALPQQQLLNALQPSSTKGAAAATAPAMQLVSPAFVLPCPAVAGSSSSSAGKHGASAQHVKTEW